MLKELAIFVVYETGLFQAGELCLVCGGFRWVYLSQRCLRGQFDCSSAEPGPRMLSLSIAFFSFDGMECPKLHGALVAVAG